jgi:NAD(P)-dependent dehydrogenase (short-subunit alcohol dehydrogenase family)
MSVVLTESVEIMASLIKNSAAKKVAVVTGASAGMGKAIVRQLLGDGWIVYGGARRADQMADLTAAGAKALKLDVTDEASMTDFVDTVLFAEGRIDALVNNAGYGSYGAVEDVPLSEARRQFDVNTFGLARMSQLVLPTMRKQRSGRIVNITSMGGRIWSPFGAWYHATKHAVEVLSDVMDFEARPFGVRVVVVQPGGVATEWGAIAAQNLRVTLQHSEYRENGSLVANVLENTKGASPVVIARVVSRALSTARPRRRYAAPFDAKALIFLRWLLPEGAWAKLIWFTVRAAANMTTQQGKANVSLPEDRKRHSVPSR